MSRVRLISTLSALLILSAPLAAQETEPAPPKAEAKAKAKTKAKPQRRRTPGVYMGRRIADVMTYQGADWLVRPEREQEEQPEKMLDALKIAQGTTVADVGAGVGYTSLRLAQRVGPTGTVLATDLQPQMLRMLADNMKTAGVKNVKPIRATQAETGLPDGKVDLILMVDVYHECSDPETTLQGLRKALKPGGRLVLVEFRGEDPEVPIKPEHKMTVAQVRRELEPQGLTFKESLEFLPWQHILIFEKLAEETKAPAESKEAAKP
jgi:ubiquinone/menaquinone biosynthesis C-methylase UbiE